MILIKIDRATIRRNEPTESEKAWSAEPRALNVMHFEITDKNLVSFDDLDMDFKVNIPGWKHGINYMVTNFAIDGDDVICKGVMLGSELPELWLVNKWEGVDIEIEHQVFPQYTKFGSEPEYLYDYEPLPEKITCHHCSGLFKSKYIGAEIWLDEFERDFDDTLCPICEERVIEYEKFNISMV